VGRLDVGVARAAQVAPLQVVGNQDQKVGPPHRLGGNRRGACGQNDEQAGKRARDVRIHVFRFPAYRFAGLLSPESLPL
jgi:hypothetical protein